MSVPVKNGCSNRARKRGWLRLRVYAGKDLVSAGSFSELAGVFDLQSESEEAKSGSTLPKRESVAVLNSRELFVYGTSW